MKKQLLLLLLLSGWAFGQQPPEFLFELYLEDAAGKMDTVVVGYDVEATDSIDTAFGEVNLINQPWASDSFEVFIINGPHYPTLKTKKQIVNKPCDENWQVMFSRTFFLSFKNGEFPIQLTLSKNVLQNSCLNGSFLALDGHPWERYSDLYQNIELLEPMYLNQSEDTDGKLITFYSLILADSSQKSHILALDDNEWEENFNIYPNPFTDKIIISDKYNITDISIKSIEGKKIQFRRLENLSHEL